MGPYLYARGSIVMKLEKYLNVQAHLATFLVDLQLGQQPSAALVKKVVNSLSKAELTAEEIKHLMDQYFTDPPGVAKAALQRFGCYRVGFARAVEAAQNRKAGKGYHIDISWSCSQPDACAVNWTDVTIGRLIHVAVLAQVPGMSLQPTNEKGQQVDSEQTMPTTDGQSHGFSLYYAEPTGEPSQWDLSRDPRQGNGIVAVG